ncbi:MAG: Holliday junction resolvase RuvX [Clostridia bacterium]|nr:Holliday junction resolvase RuvX [Clostridia bacterium]
MIILSVDYGDSRTGIAVCDKNEILATPVCTINEKYDVTLIEKITEIACNYNAALIVVGKPLNMDGSEGERAKKCGDFARKLADFSGIECVMKDERMTTVIAHQSLNRTNTRGQKRKAAVDALSAQIILQDYIDAKK